MKVILLKSVPKVGQKGDVVSVSDGYAANALFPNKAAIPANEKNLLALKKQKDSARDSKALEHALLEKSIEALPDEGLTLFVQANEKGHLFSKITEDSIVSALAKYRISIGSKNIIIENQIKELGTYTVTIKEGEYKKNVKLVVQKA